MPPVEQRILVEIVTLSFLALALAMVARQFLFPPKCSAPIPAAATEPIIDEDQPATVLAPPVFQNPLTKLDLAVACWGLLMLLFLTGIFLPQQPAARAATSPQAPHATSTLLLNFLVFQGGATFAILFYLKVLRRVSLGPLFGLWNIRPPRPPWLMFFLAVWLLIPTMALVYGTAPWWMEWLKSTGLSPRVQQGVENLDPLAPLGYRIAMLATVCVGAPVMEELFFRGFLFEATRQQTGTAFAMIFTSITFAVIHANLGAFFPLALLGLIFALLRWWLNSLFLPIFLHSLFNLSTVILKLYAQESS